MCSSDLFPSHDSWGGNIALEKLEHLLNFSSNITLISKNISEKIDDLIDKHGLKIFQKEYEKGDAKGYDIVIVEY